MSVAGLDATAVGASVPSPPPAPRLTPVGRLCYKSRRPVRR